jgi:hypothetical protein
MIVTLPLRIQTVMEAGEADSRRVRRTVGRRGHRRKVWRKVPILRPTVRASFGRGLRLAGQLTNRDGQPIGGAPIYVYSHTPASAEPVVATVSTDAHGRFTYTAQATATRTLRFVHPGSPTTLPTQDTVEILTRGRRR